MNKQEIPTQSTGASTITPWPRDASVHPSAFIGSAKNQWPGLPRLAAVVPHISKGDKKAIAAILSRFDAATELRRVHDIPGMSQAVRDGERSAGSYDDVAVACEVSRRALAEMSPELFHQSVADIAAAKVEAGLFAAGLAERLSQTLFDEFELEAQAAEQRFLKYGQPLEAKIYTDAWQDIFVLHSDAVLGPLYCETWFLRHYFVAEMKSAKLWGGSSIDWLRDIV